MLDVFKSKKFMIGLAASLINGVLVALGVSIEIAILATSPLSGALLAQGAVDVRKAGPSNGSALAVMLAAGLIGSGVYTLTGCGATQRAGASFIDCMQPNTRALAGEITGLVGDTLRNATDNTGRVDWQSVKGTLLGFKSDAPMCAFRSALVEAMRPRSSGGVQAAGLEWSPDDLRAGYTAVNHDLFGSRLAPL